MPLPTYNFEFVKGETVDLTVDYKDSTGSVIDLSSNYTVTMQGRTEASSSSTLFSLASGSGITLSSSSPNITIRLSKTVTDAITAPTSGVYDIKVAETASSPDVVKYILTGKFTVYEAVTSA